MKSKLSLAQVRKMDIFEEVESPVIVYHMTSRSNAFSIAQDRKVKCFGDYVTWFFTDLRQIPIYIYITGADEGRTYWDTDGRKRKAPPLNHEDTVILKISCRKEPLVWFKEIIDSGKKGYQNMSETQNRIWDYMNNARICHYGDLRFSAVLETIELTELDKMPPPQEIEEIKGLREQMRQEQGTAKE